MNKLFYNIIVHKIREKVSQKRTAIDTIWASLRINCLTLLQISSSIS